MLNNSLSPSESANFKIRYQCSKKTRVLEKNWHFCWLICVPYAVKSKISCKNNHFSRNYEGNHNTPPSLGCQISVPRLLIFRFFQPLGPYLDFGFKKFFRPPCLFVFFFWNSGHRKLTKNNLLKKFSIYIHIKFYLESTQDKTANNSMILLHIPIFIKIIILEILLDKKANVIEYHPR